MENKNNDMKHNYTEQAIDTKWINQQDHEKTKGNDSKNLNHKLNVIEFCKENSYYNIDQKNSNTLNSSSSQISLSKYENKISLNLTNEATNKQIQKINTDIKKNEESNDLIKNSFNCKDIIQVYKDSSIQTPNEYMFNKKTRNQFCRVKDRDIYHIGRSYSYGSFYYNNLPDNLLYKGDHYSTRRMNSSSSCNSIYKKGKFRKSRLKRIHNIIYHINNKRYKKRGEFKKDPPFMNSNIPFRQFSHSQNMVPYYSCLPCTVLLPEETKENSNSDKCFFYIKKHTWKWSSSQRETKSFCAIPKFVPLESMYDVDNRKSDPLLFQIKNRSVDKWPIVSNKMQHEVKNHMKNPTYTNLSHIESPNEPYNDTSTNTPNDTQETESIKRQFSNDAIYDYELKFPNSMNHFLKEFPKDTNFSDAMSDEVSCQSQKSKNKKHPLKKLHRFGNNSNSNLWKRNKWLRKERKSFFKDLKKVIRIKNEMKALDENLSEEKKKFEATQMKAQQKKCFEDLVEYLKTQRQIRDKYKKHYIRKISRSAFIILLYKNPLQDSFSQEEMELMNKWNEHIINDEEKKKRKNTKEFLKKYNKCKIQKKKFNCDYNEKNNITTSLIPDYNNNSKCDFEMEPTLQQNVDYIKGQEEQNELLNIKNYHTTCFLPESPFAFCEKHHTNVFDVFLFLKDIPLIKVQKKFKRMLRKKCIFLSNINEDYRMLAHMKWILLQWFEKGLHEITMIYINNCFINFNICFFLSFLLFIFKNIHTVKVTQCYLQYSYSRIFLNYLQRNKLKRFYLIRNNIQERNLANLEKYNQNYTVYFNKSFIEKEKKKYPKIFVHNKEGDFNFSETYQERDHNIHENIPLIFFNSQGFFDTSMLLEKNHSSHDGLELTHINNNMMNPKYMSEIVRTLNKRKYKLTSNSTSKEYQFNLMEECLNQNEEDTNYSKEPKINFEKIEENNSTNITKVPCTPIHVDKCIEIDNINIYSSSDTEMNNNNNNSNNNNNYDSDNDCKEMDSVFPLTLQNKTVNYSNLHNIRILKLCSNQLTDIALIYISLLIKKRKLCNLKILDLRWNHFTFKSLITLAFALTNLVSKNTINENKETKLKLRRLLLAGNNINSSLYSSFLSNFCTCNYVVVKHLDFSVNVIDNESLPITYKYFKHLLKIQNKKKRDILSDIFVNLDHNNLKNSPWILTIWEILKKFPSGKKKQIKKEEYQSEKKQVLLSIQFNDIKNIISSDMFELSNEKIRM